MKVRGQTVYTAEERIDRLSVPEPMSGCWIWLGATKRNPAGHEYGRLMVGSRQDGTRRTVSAHRLSYTTYKGAIPDGLYACHSCDNTLCVNPDHLFAGTHQDNVDDRERKGRNHLARGLGGRFSPLPANPGKTEP